MSEIIPSKDLSRGRALIQIYTDEKGQPTKRLEKLFIRTRYQSCLDPRDRIYALLSLVYKEYQININPDYSKPVEEVYKEFVLRHMEHSRSLLFRRFHSPGETYQHCHPGSPISLPQNSYQSNKICQRFWEIRTG